MGFWSGIKYALNSTLGTEDFKPLNEIINDSSYIVATDDVLYNIGDVPAQRLQEIVFFEKVVTSNGVIRLSCKLGISESLIVRIYVNETLVVSLRGDDDTDGSVVSTYDINVNRNDVLKLTVYASGNGYVAEEIKLCGTPVFSPYKGIFVE